MGDRRSNDYYDDDEEGYEQDEYEEEEERRPPPKPTKGEQDFLKFREGLKDKYRHNKTSKQPTHDKFGSFFGPSKPVIALRVIEETKSLKETSFQNSSAKHPGSSTSKVIASSSSKHKSSTGYSHRPKVNEVKKKAQTLKEARDYSFLFSDDADLPEQNSTKNVSKPASQSRPDRASTSQAGNRQPIRSQSNAMSAASNARSSHSNGHRSAPPSDGHRSSASNGNRSASSSNGHRSEPSKEHRSTPLKQRQPLPQREKERPMQQRKPPLPPSKAPLKSVNGSSSNNRQNVVRKNPNMADPSSSVQRRPVQDGRRDPVQDKSRTGTRPVSSSSKHQVSRQDEDINRRREMKKKKKRPLERGGDTDISSMIRDIMGYNPNKYAGRDDDDDSDMEVGFNVIQKEERMSSKIAKKEDEEELRLIEEEERRERERERMRKKQKKR